MATFIDWLINLAWVFLRISGLDIPQYSLFLCFHMGLSVLPVKVGDGRYCDKSSAHQHEVKSAAPTTFWTRYPLLILSLYVGSLACF